MNGNQGLEALASLCGGASKVRTTSENAQSNQSITADESAMMPPPSSHLMHPNVMNLQNHAVSNKTQISQQQLYQALLSAANANGNMPFSMSNPGFHQRPISSADAGASGAAQQLAFYNHLYNVQVATATQQAMQYNAASQQNSPMFEKNQNVVEQQIAAALAIASGSGGVIPQMRLQGES